MGLKKIWENLSQHYAITGIWEIYVKNLNTY